MYDRQALLAIQEEEEKAFKSLPEEQQKMATATTKDEEPIEGHVEGQEPVAPFELKPLLSEEKQALKTKLLDEGFSGWKRHEYTLFVKASARHGRNSFENIALEVGKLEEVVRRYASAFWGDLGKSRISEHEYGRVVKLVEKGERKISEIRALERGARVLVSHFDNPWEELEFTYVNCKDKMFTAEEDRHLLCWTRKVSRILVTHLSLPPFPAHFSLFCGFSMVMGSGRLLGWRFVEIPDSGLTTFSGVSLLIYLEGGANN